MKRSDSAVYQVVPLTSFGRITGTVGFDGPVPTDSIVHVTTDIDICGQTFVDSSVSHRGSRLSDVVVWLEGVTAGKPLPVTKRFDVTSDRCRVVPRVQAAIVGGTLNVRNADQGSHLARFTRWPDDQLLGTISETEAGAVVPTRTVLAEPGLVEVRCDFHSWSHGWIAVFRHPYFATTDGNGAFSIDSVPPGRYRLTVWQERFGVHSDSVTVVAGSPAVVNLRLTAQAGNSPSAARNWPR